MNEELERIYSEALDLLEQGASTEAILARFPGYAADLRLFLRTAAGLATLATQPGLTAEQRSKRAFLAGASETRRGQARRGPSLRLARIFTPALALLVVAMLGGAALVGRSGAALPGSALYETKRLVEDVRLGLVNDPERAAGLRERFRLERTREVERLLAAGATADVTFTGVVEAVVADARGERWTVAGLPVLVRAATGVDGQVRPGALVEVSGRTGAGLVVAARVMLLTGAPAAATPSPAVPTAAVGAASPTATMPASATAASATPTFTPTATASPTATTPVAPATPASATSTPDDHNDNGDNNNDNAGDNNNDNAGDNKNDNSGDNQNDNSGNENDNGDNQNDNSDNHNTNDNRDDNHNDNSEGGD